MGSERIDPLVAAQAMVLGDEGYSSHAIARETGISQRTAYDIIHRIGHWGEVADTPVYTRHRLEQKRALQEASMSVAARALLQVDNQIDKASAYQAAGIYGLLRTHERLDAGEPAMTSASLNVNAAASLDDIAQALASRLGK